MESRPRGGPLKKRRNLSHISHERWLVSYADFITLLFALFVVLYASAQVDKRKVNQLSAAIQNAFQELGSFSGSPRTPRKDPLSSARNNAVVPPEQKPVRELDRLEADLRSALSAELERREVAIYNGPDGLVLSLREVGFFDSGSAILRKQALHSFRRISTVLSSRPYRIRVEGHTDNGPIHNRDFASNWELSTSRATEVTRLLIEKFGFDPSVLAAAGYAEFHPVADNATLEGRQNNRRVDLVIHDPSPPNLHTPIGR
jgi:chemotaxis protein MotB